MTGSQTISERLKNLDTYLPQFPEPQRPIHFEQLVAEAFSHVFYLPFYARNNENSNIPYRVVWQGTCDPFSIAPPNASDAVAYCCNFYLLIEATLKTGANQWTQEFAQSIRHSEDFCSQERIQQKDVFVLVICTDLHRDTYQSIKSNSGKEYRLIPIKVSELSRILETSILVFTLRHLELRRLFNQISRGIRDSSSAEDFARSVDGLITTWQKYVLQLEKSAFIGKMSYEAMREIRRLHIGTSEILRRLQTHETVKKYFAVIGDKIDSNIIEESLVQQSLASRLGSTYEDEQLFELVPIADFKERSLRLIKAVEKING